MYPEASDAIVIVSEIGVRIESISCFAWELFCWPPTNDLGGKLPTDLRWQGAFLHTQLPAHHTMSSKLFFTTPK
jgi:hypothetical protein